MNRIISVVATLLVLAGLGILAFVGVSYAVSIHSSAPSPHWSRAQQKSGRQIASRLGGQTIKVPTRTTVIQGSEPATRIVIPKIDVDSPIVQTPPVNGVWQVADWQVGHLNSTPNPGSPGNGAYAAHDDIKGEIFKRVGQLAPGDSVWIYTTHYLYRYIVVRQLTVSPSDVAVLNPTIKPTITLISCSPYWVDTYRLAVQADLKSSTRV